MNNKKIKINDKLSKFDWIIIALSVFVFIFILLFWRFHPFGILCYYIMAIAYLNIFYNRFATIKTFEVDKDNIVIQKKDEIITVKQNDKLAFKLVAKNLVLI